MTPSITFRSPSLAVLGWAGMTFFTMIFAVAAAAVPNNTAFAGALIFAGMAYVAWLTGVHSKIRMDHSG